MSILGVRSMFSSMGTGTLIPVCLGLLFCINCAQQEQQPEEQKQVNPMTDFGTTAGNIFLYYDDLGQATKFYAETLGMKIVIDYGFARMLQVAPTSYITLVDHNKGMHSTDEPKTVAIALVTDQLDEWWDYLSKQDVEFRNKYNPTEGRPHDGFVAYDPEGYYLEFERFNTHPENEKFTPVLERTETVYPDPDQTTTVPEGLGFKAMIVWGYYKDMEGIQRFYEEVMGMEMIVDQGWTKIYPTSPSSYIGLVDEARGMHKFSEEKAVTISFFTDDIEGWFSYLNNSGKLEMRSKEVNKDSERFLAFVAYDPEGYFLEFDTFFDIEDNEKLLKSMGRK